MIEILGWIFVVILIITLIACAVWVGDFLYSLKQGQDLQSKKHEYLMNTHLDQFEKKLVEKIDAVDQKLRGRCHIIELKIGMTPEELKK